MRFVIVLFLAFSILCSCQSNDKTTQQNTTSEYDGEKITSSINNGPISVNTTVYPKNPKLGDVITLIVEVVASESLVVKMPPFGEALGRFQIANFQPHEATLDDNKRKYRQQYKLQAPMSGLQKIPPLRIVYVDNSISNEEREILTDDIAIEIQTLLEEDAPLTLTSPKSTLIVNKEMGNIIVPLIAGIVTVLLSAFGFWYYRKHQQKLIIQNAYMVAIQALGILQSQDFEGRLDEFYAELSLIIRRYISSRYGLKAVERTTEEFLSITKTSKAISESQRLFVGDILKTCDVMKFTKEKQGGLNHQEQIQSVKKFLDDTTPQEDRA